MTEISLTAALWLVAAAFLVGTGWAVSQWLWGKILR